MRAMPSPTSSTRPTSWASRPPRTSWISLSSTETISLGLNRITASLDELVADLFQPRADAAVVQRVADLHGQAAQERGIDARLQHRLAAQRRPQLLAQLFLLVVGQRHGRLHLHAHLARPLLVHVADGGGDGPDRVETVVFVE